MRRQLVSNQLTEIKVDLAFMRCKEHSSPASVFTHQEIGRLSSQLKPLEAGLVSHLH